MGSATAVNTLVALPAAVTTLHALTPGEGPLPLASGGSVTAGVGSGASLVTYFLLGNPRMAATRGAVLNPSTDNEDEEEMDALAEVVSNGPAVPTADGLVATASPEGLPGVWPVDTVLPLAAGVVAIFDARGGG